MTAETKRVVVLVSVLAVAGLVVVLDRAGRSGAAEESEGAGVRAVYLAETGLYEQTAAVADARDEWEEAANAAEVAWDERRAKMISAPSAEIAAARLRGLIEQVLLDEGMVMTTSETLPNGRSGSDAPVVAVGLSLSFEAKDSAPVYRVIDRIEHLSDVATTIEAVTLRGPGRLGSGGSLQATLRLRAVALIEGASRG